LVETVGIEQSDGIAVAAAVVVGQSIKMAEAITQLDCLASRLILRLCIWLYIGLYRTRLLIKAPSVVLRQALHRQALRPHRFVSGYTSGYAFGCTSVALYCIFCVYICVYVYIYGPKTLIGDASDNLLTVY
jgi:hypothetical protein